MQKIKPSTILLKKSKGAKQIIGDLFGQHSMKNKSYCALGLLACKGGMIKNIDSFDKIGEDEIAKHFGLIKTIKMDKCLEVDCDYYEKADREQIYDIIMHLNDGHKWTFKQIGNWLRKIGK